MGLNNEVNVRPINIADKYMKEWGIKVFSKDHSLQLFNSSIIIEHEGNAHLPIESQFDEMWAVKQICDKKAKLITAKQCERGIQVGPLDNKVDLSSLFKLMSILPQESALLCKSSIDIDNYDWKITLELVASVFINWGMVLANYDLLALVGNVKSCEQPKERERDIPTPSNIQLVLDAIRCHTPSDRELPVEHKNIILKILTWAAMDQSMVRVHLCLYSKAISAIVASFDSWDYNQMDSTLYCLDLRYMGDETVVNLPSRLFYLTNDRMKALAIRATLDTVNRLLGLSFLEKTSLTELIEDFHNMLDAIDSYSKRTVCYIVQLVNNLVVLDNTVSEESLRQVLTWANSLKNIFTSYPYNNDLESGFVGERISRFVNECSCITRDRFNKTLQQILIV